MSSLRVAEGLLMIEQRLRIGRHRPDLGRQFLDPDLCRIQPLLIAAERSPVCSFSSASSMIRPCSRSIRNILPGCRRHFLTIFSSGIVSTPDLRRHHAEVVVGDHVAGRAQAVAVERGADHPAVGEGDRRWAVPRLHQRRMVLVEGAPLLVHQRIVVPRLRGIIIIIACGRL